MLAARRRVAAPWIVLLTLLPPLARAQTGAASNAGLVADQTGDALPGVTITARNQSTDVPYVAMSNETGNYTITSLPVGAYVVSVELPGFRPGGGAGRSRLTHSANGDHDGRRGHLGQHGADPAAQRGRNTAQLTLLLPGTMTWPARIC
jgi:Carboxypeptidase regulatory-like domain